MAPALQLTLPPTPSSAQAARRAAAEVVRPRDAELADTVELLASELVANAVQHAATPFDFRVELEGERIRLAVRDEDRQLPERHEPGPDDLFGRGLVLVDALASDWGAEAMDEGKIVWCVVST